MRHLTLTFFFAFANIALAGKPNIIFIMVDDLGKDWISCYGADNIQTPHIDKLAKGGIFQRVYSLFGGRFGVCHQHCLYSGRPTAAAGMASLTWTNKEETSRARCKWGVGGAICALWLGEGAPCVLVAFY